MKRFFLKINEFLFSNLTINSSGIEYFLFIYLIILISIYSLIIKICSDYANNTSDLHRCNAKINNVYTDGGTNQCSINIPNPNPNPN